MWNELLYAVDENGKQYPFAQQRFGNSLLLTLKKETIQKVKQLRALPALSTAAAGDAGYYILPRSLRLRGEIQTFFTERADATFSYSRPLMSWYGIKKQDFCALIRVERNYNYRYEITVQNNIYTACPLFDFTQNDPLYDDIRIELIMLPADADYNTMARTERALRLERGELRTLQEKCQSPAVEYARKYPLVRIRMAWKPSPSPYPFQTEENEPELFIACDFKRVREIADELKRQGVEGAELQLVGWNRSGHDGRYPQLFPADPRLGGNEEFKKTIDHVKALGYRISTHTNSCDCYTIADTFDWNDVALDREGNYVQIGHWGGGDCFRICPIKQLKNAKRDLPVLAEYGENGVHYTDVTSIILPDDCHSPDHPSNLSNGILYIQTLMDYTRGLFGAFSSEGCLDFTLKELDFGLYVSFGGSNNADCVCDRYLPVWEVAYHGTVLYNPIATTVNCTAQSPADQLTLLLRGGKPAMYLHSKFRANGKDWMGDGDLTCQNKEAIARSVRLIKEALEIYTPFAEKQLIFMRSYDILDNGLEIATYEDGSAVCGNFSDATVTHNGVPIEPWECKWIS